MLDRFRDISQCRSTPPCSAASFIASALSLSSRLHNTRDLHKPSHRRPPTLQLTHFVRSGPNRLTGEPTVTQHSPGPHSPGRDSQDHRQSIAPAGQLCASSLRASGVEEHHGDAGSRDPNAARTQASCRLPHRPSSAPRHLESGSLADASPRSRMVSMWKIEVSLDARSRSRRRQPLERHMA